MRSASSRILSRISSVEVQSCWWCPSGLLQISRRSAGLQLLQQIRDEAHRFGVQYHRHRRSSRTLRSGLVDVPGVGPERQKALMKHFGSLKRLKAASLDEVQEVRGIGPSLAKKILQHLSEGNGAAG